MTTDASRPSLLEFLCRVSLEPPGVWWMFIGPNLSDEPPYLDIGHLFAFTFGYRRAESRASNEESDAFFAWLRDEACAFPGQGWARHLLEVEEGDHEAAIRRFFGFVHEYLLLRRPAWFVRFNQEPRPSMLANGFGTPKSSDVRRPDHVASTGGDGARSGVDIRVSAVDFAPSSFHVGLPNDVRSWWNGNGRRIAMVLRSRGRRNVPEQVLSAVQGRRNSLHECLEEIVRGCADADVDGFGVVVGDVVASQFIVQVRGRCGASWVRDGVQLATAAEADGELSWATQAGDRVLLLSSVLFELATKVGLGPLPSQLVTAEPIAWTQAIESAARRLAVCVEWPDVAKCPGPGAVSGAGK